MKSQSCIKELNVRQEFSETGDNTGVKFDGSCQIKNANARETVQQTRDWYRIGGDIN